MSEEEIRNLFRDGISWMYPDKKQEECIEYFMKLQQENEKLNKVIDGIEDFIKYLNKHTSNWIVSNTYIVILAKLKSLKGSDE